MRCIFCKAATAGSRSVEHIIPEALGNTDHVLPCGVVCDSCNNYFARKVEQPLLESVWFKHARSRQWIANKRGRVPPMRALIPAACLAADLWTNGSTLTFQADNPREDALLARAILSGRATRAYLPHITAIDERLMARFLAKVAIEILAQRLIRTDGWQEQIIDDPQLDGLRRFARIGDIPLTWPISRRRIYGEDDIQEGPGGGYQVLHEYTLLYTDQTELYAVVCLFGEEFAINCAGPEVSGYTDWLAARKGCSPLYIDDVLPVPPPALSSS